MVDEVVLVSSSGYVRLMSCSLAPGNAIQFRGLYFVTSKFGLLIQPGVHSFNIMMIRFYSTQLVATIDTTKYTIENDFTKKEKKTKKTNTQTNGMYLSKAD